MNGGNALDIVPQIWLLIVWPLLLFTRITLMERDAGGAAREDMTGTARAAMEVAVGCTAVRAHGNRVRENVQRTKVAAERASRITATLYGA